MTDTNKMREEFEDFAPNHIYLGQYGFDKYPDRSQEYDAMPLQAAWEAWQESRQAVVVDPSGLTDEALTAAYWDFDARRKGYPPYTAPAGQECSAFKVAIVAAIEAQGLRAEVKP